MAANAAKGPAAALAARGPALAWARAVTVGQGPQQLVLVPMVGDAALFERSAYGGARYLVVAKAANSDLNGNIVELLLRRAAPLDTAALLAGLYQSYQRGQWAAPARGEGAVLLYGADYGYLTGRRFRDGRVLPGEVQLWFAPPAGSAAATAKRSAGGGGAVANNIPPTGGCVDWYLWDGTSWIFTNSTGDCNVYTPPAYGNYPPPGGSGSGPDSYGGHPRGSGGGGGSGSSPQATLSISLGNLRPCAGQVVADLQSMAKSSPLTGGPVANMIAAVSSNPNLHITFAEQANLRSVSGNVDEGQTRHVVGTNEYTITLNSDFLLGSSQATDLATANTVVHEILHAYMFDWAERHNLGPNPELTRVMNLYFDPKNTDHNGTQHRTMADMIGYMGAAVAQYANMKPRLQPITQVYCESLAWQGLTGTDAFTAHAAVNSLWADNINLVIASEVNPDKAGFQLVTLNGLVTVPPAKGSQPCP